MRTSEQIMNAAEKIEAAKRIKAIRKINKRFTDKTFGYTAVKHPSNNADVVVFPKFGSSISSELIEFCIKEFSPKRYAVQLYLSKINPEAKNDDNVICLVLVM